MDQMPTPDEIARMTPEEKQRSLAEFIEFMKKLAGPPVEVFVPRPFALAIDFEDVQANAALVPRDIVAVGIESDSDAMVRVRNPYTRRTDNFVFRSAAEAQAVLGGTGAGTVRLIWGEPLVPAQAG